MGHASKAELRDMRKVEVNFQYNTHGGSGAGRGRRREEERPPVRDVDISTLPRDEQAYYRIQQAQQEMASREARSMAVPPVRPHSTAVQTGPVGSTSTSAAPTRRIVDNFPPLGGSQSPQTTSSAPQQPPNTSSSLPPEVAARHASVIEKAKQLLNLDIDKLNQFKSQVSSFRRGDSTATELIDTLWDIFNTKLDEFGKVITSTADLFDYDAKSKRTELLGSWNDWKIQVPPQ